jgi:hypothetical protein
MPRYKSEIKRKNECAFLTAQSQTTNDEVQGVCHHVDQWVQS